MQKSFIIAIGFILLQQFSLAQDKPAAESPQAPTLPVKQSLKLDAPEKTEKKEKPERDALDFLDNIDYPELQVVPRASERLETEAQFERDGGSWLNQWSFLISGATTLSASTLASASVGSAATSDQLTYIKLGQIVGGITLGVGMYYGFAKPYDSTLDKVRRIRGKDKRSALLRERTAEEALEKTANTIGSISTLSVWANLITSASLAGFGDSNSRSYAYAAIFVSTLTMMFPHPYITNWEKHKEYKHKIYSPLPTASVHRDSKTGEVKSYIGLAWNY